MSARAAFRYLILAWALARVRTSAAFSARSWAGEELGIFGESSSGGRSAWSSECSVPTNGGWFRLRGSDRNDEGRPRRVSGGAGLSPENAASCPFTWHDGFGPPPHARRPSPRACFPA